MTSNRAIIYDNKTHCWELVELKFPLLRDYQNARISNVPQRTVIWIGSKKNKFIKIKDFVKGKMEIIDEA